MGHWTRVYGTYIFVNVYKIITKQNIHIFKNENSLNPIPVIRNESESKKVKPFLTEIIPNDMWWEQFWIWIKE